MVGYLPTYLFFIIYVSLWTNTFGVVKIKVIVSFQEIFTFICMLNLFSFSLLSSYNHYQSF